MSVKTSSMKSKEYRFRCSDGSYKWLETIAKTLYDETGKPSGLILNSRDITERIKVQEDLIRIVQALKCSSDAIGMADQNGSHFYQNAAFSSLFKYEVKELTALGIDAVYDGKDIAREVLDTIKKGGSWTGEVEMKSKSGRRFPVYLRADAIKDYKGKIVGLMGLHTNIKERKEFEEKLKKHLKKYTTCP